MGLNSGTRIGPYEVVSPIGAGGMGEVYKARDTRPHRDVAIKVLPELFANDAERLARFTRAAQTLAALNHPDIAAIHGIEGQALVMAPNVMWMDATTDRQKFLVISPERTGIGAITVVENWRAALEKT